MVRRYGQGADAALTGGTYRSARDGWRRPATPPTTPVLIRNTFSLVTTATATSDMLAARQHPRRENGA